MLYGMLGLIGALVAVLEWSHYQELRTLVDNGRELIGLVNRQNALLRQWAGEASPQIQYVPAEGAVTMAEQNGHAEHEEIPVPLHEVEGMFGDGSGN